MNENTPSIPPSPPIALALPPPPPLAPLSKRFVSPGVWILGKVMRVVRRRNPVNNWEWEWVDARDEVVGATIPDCMRTAGARRTLGSWPFDSDTQVKRRLQIRRVPRPAAHGHGYAKVKMAPGVWMLYKVMVVTYFRRANGEPPVWKDDNGTVVAYTLADCLPVARNRMTEKIWPFLDRPVKAVSMIATPMPAPAPKNKPRNPHSTALEDHLGDKMTEAVLSMAKDRASGVPNSDHSLRAEIYAEILRYVQSIS